MDSDEGELLVVLLEIHPTIVGDPSDQKDAAASTPLEQVLVFLNCFTLLSAANELVVFGVLENSCPLLHRSSGGNSSSTSRDTSELLASTGVMTSIKNLLKDAPGLGTSGDGLPALSAGLSRAVCFLHRQKQLRQGRLRSSKSRILTLTASGDVSAQHIATMNALFSAQHADIVIDTCHIGPEDSPFLQQASHLTGGTYTRPSNPHVLLQYLISTNASDSRTRQFLRTQTPQNVSFKASCFCHKNAIDVGFVCSVCLSIFCKRIPECTTCGTTFSADQPA